MTRKVTQKGFSLIELLIVVAVILVLAAIAIPNYVKSRMRAHEAAAVGALHAINSACENYAVTYGKGFPPLLTSLGPAAVPSTSAADLLDNTLASGSKSGYTFAYSAAPPVNGVINSYTIIANPTNRGVTGQRGFYTDQALVIRANANGTASRSDTPIG
jgi:type IV pilus assembly protein PilA